MNRSIGMERTYWLGEYRNIKISDYISDIPDEIVLSSKAMRMLRNLQMNQVDTTFVSYIRDSVSRHLDLQAEVNALDEILANLNDVYLQTKRSLMEVLQEESTDAVETVEKSEDK